MNKRINSIFFSLEVDKDQFILYNSKNHTPIKVDKKGKEYFDILEKYTFKKNDCMKNEKIDEKDNFIDFFESLDEINFFSTSIEAIDKRILYSNYNDHKKTFYLHLTDRCNLKCNYCYNESYRHDLDDLSFKSWKTIINKLIPFANEFIITGGECLLHKSFNEIIEYIKDKNEFIKIKIFSNGCHDFSLLNLKPIIEYIDVVNLSCDSLKNENHERVGFNKDVFLKNIKYLRKIGFNNSIAIHSVWTKGRLEEVFNVRCFCEQNKFKSVFSLLIPNRKMGKDNMPTLKEYEDFLSDNKFINSNTDAEIYDEDKSICNKTITCGAANHTFSIDSRGNCYPCQSFHFPEFNMGNLLNTGFKEIYNSPIALMLRIANDVDNKLICKDCNLKYICAGGCIANTYEIEGNLFAFPVTLCPYYKAGSINRLQKVKF